jgi:hydroxymethylglutaryl-CoA lyase
MTIREETNMSRYPTVHYKEEGMREGMQIEDANISVEDKVELLDALSETGLKHIVVCAFVSPKWTPQMARVDEIVTKFHPKEGVIYSALALNERGIERAKAYSPPLTFEHDPYPRLMVHMCDVFVRRNANRSQMQEIERWPQKVAKAQELNVTKAGIGTNASWGSNFLGGFSVDSLMTMLEKQHGMWDEAGIKVVSCLMGDPMSHCTPAKVEESVYRIKERWPDITNFRLHLHDGRNMAIASAYAAIRTLTPEDTLELDGTIGGFGGCPYCGNGRATGMAPSEDLLHMLEDMGIETGVDIDKLIDCVWMAEAIVGRPLTGHVSKAGPRPKHLEQLYDINAPFVETHEQAKHFKNGPEVYKGGFYPYKEPISSPYRDRVERGQPAYDQSDGDFPWKQDWIPAS